MKLREILNELDKSAIENKSSKIYICGGLVRDRVMGNLKNVNDIDLTSGSTDIQLVAYHFYEKMSKNLNIGLKQHKDNHITISFSNLKIDFSSHFIVPEVEKIIGKQLTELEKEIYSRDFTCNSLLLDTSYKETLDLTNRGIKDIEKKQIVTCLEPTLTLKSSGNRVSRAIYLACKLDFDIDIAIINAIKNNPMLYHIGYAETIKKKTIEAFEKNNDKAKFYFSKMNLWSVITDQEILTYRK